jgi:hypothetical protein
MDASDSDDAAFWGAGSLMLNSRSMEIGAESVSLKNRKVMSQAKRAKLAGIAQGRK